MTGGRLEAHQQETKLEEQISNRRLGEHVTDVVVGRYRYHTELAGLDVGTKEMITNVEMLGPWPELRSSSHLVGSGVILEELAMDIGGLHLERNAHDSV